MSDAPMAPARSCPRCGLRPCRIGQRLCPECHRDYKRERRATPRPVQPRTETLEGAARETPETAGERETAGNGVVQTPNAFPAKGRRGRQVPPDWRPRFLEFYDRHGVRWRAAKYAGVSHDTVLRSEYADPDFARQVEDARQSYLDRHALNLNRLAFKKDNVVASIVALKAGRPAQYVEKNMTISATFSTELGPDDGKVLLRTMLAHATDATVKALALPAPAEPPPA